MSPEEFLTAFEKQRPQLEAWGSHLASAVEKKFKDILKIPPKHRVKETFSILGKAFYRGKNYKDPLNDITDKVGVRFVVLLEDEVEEISDYIRRNALWDWSEDKNIEAERSAKPSLFEYKSNHFIVRPKVQIDSFWADIPAGIPCEVQIRTLLQHAYSELSHGLIYKPKFTVQSKVVRQFARSMALIETTDNVFVHVNKDMKEEEKVSDEILDYLISVYMKMGLSGFDKSTNYFIADALRAGLEDVRISDMRAYIEAKPFVLERIKEMVLHNKIMAQPASLLAFYMAERQPTQLVSIWPYTTSDLIPVFTILGKKMPGEYA